MTDTIKQNQLVDKMLIPHGPMTLAEAFATVFRKRPWVRPNDGFWSKLELLEIDKRTLQLSRFASEHYSRSGVVLLSPMMSADLF